VAHLSGPGTPGFNRVVLNLRPAADLLDANGGEGREFVRPWENIVTLTDGERKDVRKLLVTTARGIETR
jgi:hypothetical protein